MKDASYTLTKTTIFSGYSDRLMRLNLSKLKNPAKTDGIFQNEKNGEIILLPSGFLRIPSGACSEHR